MSKLKVCVLGAGVIGLSSAKCLLEEFPELDLTITASEFPPKTTSDVAAGFWFPHALSDTPKYLTTRWGESTRDHLIDLFNRSVPESGVQLISGFMVNEEDIAGNFSHLLLRWSEMTENESKMFDPIHKERRYVSSIMCEGEIYTNYLIKEAIKLGAKCEKRKIKKIEELFADYDLIVNCTGSGAKELLGDENMYMLRGQAIRVKAPWIKQCYIQNKGEYYVFPGRDYVILGGTHQLNDLESTPRPSDADDIWRGCCKLVPSLKNGEIIKHCVGFRPCRSTIRLEKEVIPFKGRRIQVIHNYGHGGSGLTLHHGCAKDVVSLVKGNSKSKM